MWSSYVPAGYEDPDELKTSDSSDSDAPAGYEDPDAPPKPVKPPSLLARIGKAIPSYGSMHDPNAPTVPAVETVQTKDYPYQMPKAVPSHAGQELPRPTTGAVRFTAPRPKGPVLGAAPSESVVAGVPLYPGHEEGYTPETEGQPNLTTGQAIQRILAATSPELVGTGAGDITTELPTGEVKKGTPLYPAGANQRPTTTSGGPQTLEEVATRMLETSLPTGEVKSGTPLYGGGTRNQPVNQAPTTTPGGGAAVAAGAAQGLAGLGDMLASPEALGLLVGIPAIASLLPARAAAVLNAAATGKFGFDIGHGIATEQAAELGDAIGSKDPQKIAAALTGIAGSFLMLLHPAKERSEEAAARAAKEPPASGPLTNEVGDHFMHLGKEGIEPSAGATGPFEVPADIKREWTLGGLVPDALKQGKAAAAAISARADELEAQFQAENQAKRGPLLEQKHLREEPPNRVDFEEAAKQEIQDEKAAVSERNPGEGAPQAAGLGRPADQEHGEAVNAGGGIPEHGPAPEDAGAAERPAGGRGERGAEDAAGELTPGEGLPPRTADTMSDAIALSSPSGRMSKRARAAADKRLGEALFGQSREGLKGPGTEQPTERESLLRQAKQLRELAERGMSTRLYTKKAADLEARAAALPEGVAPEVAPTGEKPVAPPPGTESKTPLLSKSLAEKRGKKMTGAEIEARRAAYFTPGAVVDSYGGTKDRVIAYQPATEANGLNWSVDVQGLDKAGNPEGPIRRHATEPDWKKIRRVAPKGEEPAAAEKQPWQMTPAEWDAEFEQTRANAQGTGGDTKYGGMGRSTTEKGLGERVKSAQERQDFLKTGLPDEDVEGLPVPARHFQVVREAMRRGLPVPKGVLDEYPELSQKTATAAAESLHEGKEGRLTMADGEKVPFRFGVIEAGDLVTSHNDDLSVNPKARTELQGRDRTKGISRLQVSAIEKNPDFDRLEAAPTPDVGAPIVNRMGEALGGQGRTIGLRRAYRKGNADEYRRQLEARAADYGLDPKDFAEMKHPVLVRVTGGVRDEAAFAEKTNVSAGLSLSASEKGRQDAKKLTPAVLDIADPEADLAAPRNAAFVGRFINELVPKNERGPLLDEKTGISPEGVQRVRAALIASAYGDTPPARRLLEELPEDTRSIQKALVDAAPAIASAQVAMKAGDVQQVDFTGPILETADLLHKMAMDGTTLKQFLEPKFGELLPVERGPETDRLLRFFEENKRKPKEIVGFLRALADTVQTFETSKTESLFGDELKGEPPTQAEVYEIARRTYDEVSHEQTALFAEEPEPANPRGPSTEGGAARGGADQEPLPERGEHPAVRGVSEAGLELPTAADRGPRGDQRSTLAAGAEAGVPGRADRTLPSEGDVAAERHIAGGPPLGPQQSLGAGAPGDLDSAPMGARLTAAMQALSGKATGPEKVYSRLGHTKDVAGGYGLNQLAEAAPDVSTMARKASSAQAKAHALIRETLPKLADALGDGKKSVEKFFAALADNRLRGIVDKYDAMKNEAAAMDADNLLSNGDRWHSFLDAVEGRRGFEDADLLGPFEQAMDRGDAEAVRRLVIDTADKASDEVGQVHLGDEDTFEKYTKTPEFKEALKVYKDDLETTLRNAHALNDGYFTEHLGPLDTYFPLSSINEQQNVGAPRRPAFKKPPNPNNPFATGLGEYDTSVEAFHKNLARALRQNGRAAVIESARDAGVLTQLKAGMPAPPTVLYEGREFTAKTVETGTRMLVNKDGRVVRIPSPKGVLPEWAYEELKPILEPDLKTEEAAWKKLASAATVFNMGGPTDAVYHSLNLYGTLMLRTPFVGTDLMSKIASNVPTPLNLGRALAGLVNIIDTKPASLENARRFREMVENGQIPSRYGTATYSKAYSKLTGAEYGGLRKPWHTNEEGKLRPRLPIDFSPMIFGPNGIDVRARILLDKIGEHIANESGHEWTPEERFNWGRQMGNYVKETEGRIERAAKGSGLAPFYTAGRQMNWNALSGMLGAGHLPLGEGKSQVANKYRAMMVMNGVVGSVATWALMNYAYRGVWPWDDKESRLGQIALNPEDRKSGLARKIYGDDTAKTAWVNAWALNPLLSRGLRISGAKALLEGAITKVPFDKRVDQAEVDMLNGFAHPFLGPPTHLLTRSAFGIEPYIQSLQERSRPAVRFKSAFHDYVEPGLAGIGQRLVSGLEGANPITRRILDARTQGQPAARVAFDTFLPNLFKGPYRTNSPLERELMDITLANAPAPSKERLEKVKLLRQLDNARGAEDQSQYRTLLSSLKSKYGMNERDTRKIDAHPEHVIENQFKALSLPEAVRVFKLGTDDQQKTLRIPLQRKLMGMAGMKDLEPDARADVIKEARQLLNREPSKYAAASR